MQTRQLAYAAAVYAVVAGLALLTGPLAAQQGAEVPSRVLGTLASPADPGGGVMDREPFATVEDSLAWEGARTEAHTANGTRLVISLRDRRLFWMDGPDTLFVAPVAVGSGDTLSYRDRAWEFETPRGVRRVIGKEENPTWVPPLWHYVSYARETGREMVELRAGRDVTLSDGSRVGIRQGRVGRIAPDGAFEAVPQGEHVVFDDTVFVPPFGTVNRQIPDELGAYKLDLGEAYLIHGTPHEDSIGRPVTRGCIRLGDEDLALIYRSIHVGTEVHIY